MSGDVTHSGGTTDGFEHESAEALTPGSLRGFRLTVIDGPNQGASYRAQSNRCTIGSHPTNDLTIDDPTVSRFHTEVEVAADGVRARDCKSRNGTVVDGLRIIEAYLRDGSLLRMGSTVVRFEVEADPITLPLSERDRFGALLGTSIPMRAVFALLERAATSSATVLLTGETGTGKERAAEGIHHHSDRSDGPFVVVDCGAIPGELLESQLFGHEKGAFTGADTDRTGAFEDANGGTLFLDEIGELPLELQPALLRALEARKVRRVGSNTYRPIDFRVIAATNRDLREEVNAGRFRADLYYRLAVVRIELPPLRKHPEDTPLLVRQLIEELGADPETDAAWLTTPAHIARMQAASWSGNVRELRNYLEQCLVFQQTVPLSRTADPGPSSFTADDPFAAARRKVMNDFERRYLEQLMTLHGGKTQAAAEAAGIGRVYLYKLLRRHGLHRPR